MVCNSCPRKCGIDRSKATGYCGCGDSIRVAKIMRHFGEEPPITGKNGSGTIFFSGCVLKCPFCQNFPISHKLKGTDYSENELEKAIFELQEQGVHNINFCLLYTSPSPRD